LRGEDDLGGLGKAALANDFDECPQVAQLHETFYKRLDSSQTSHWKNAALQHNFRFNAEPRCIRR
jgi:hypothetical protein